MHDSVQTELNGYRQETERLQSDMDDWRDRHDAREAELNALRSAVGLPWWRRLLTTKEG